MSKAVIVCGGTGFIGRHLVRHLLQRQYDVIILTRTLPENDEDHEEGVTYASWDTTSGSIDPGVWKNAFAIINLAGAGVVDKPWTNKYKQEIIDSRVHSSKTIIRNLNENTNHIEVVVNASAMGYYGSDRSVKPFMEDDPAADDFLGQACVLWENSIKPVEQLNKRLAIFRFGIVLGHDGGAMQEFLKPLKFRTATYMGNGKQIVSWIHIDDLCRMLIYPLENDSIQGVYNAVAPGVVSNRKLVTAMAHALYGDSFMTLSAPAFALKLAMGERSQEVLKSCTVSSKKIQGTGFQYRYPGIEEATKNIARELHDA